MTPARPPLHCLALCLSFAAASATRGGVSFELRQIPLTADFVLSIAAGDFDADGDADLAVGVVPDVGIDDQILIFENDGAANFTQITALAVPTRPVEILAADLDGDGRTDLAVSLFTPGNRVAVFLNDGAGGFGSRQDFFVNAVPRGLAAGDLDGDGDLDLVNTQTGVGTSRVMVLHNDGSGGFASMTTYDVGTFPTEVTVGDWDADGDLDLAVSNRNAGTISVLYNDGSGGFPTQGIEPLSAPGALAPGVAHADMDGDGAPDLLAAFEGFPPNWGVSVLPNDGSGDFLPEQSFASPFAGPILVHPFDIEGDGDADVALSISPGGVGGILVYENDGSGTLAAPTALMTGAIFDTTVADLDGDGDDDLATAQTNNSLARVVMLYLNTTPQVGVPGDIDGDGDVDLIDLSLLLNAFGTCSGDTGFDPNADFDGSGCVDLIDLSTLLNNFGA